MTIRQYNFQKHGVIDRNVMQNLYHNKQSMLIPILPFIKRSVQQFTFNECRTRNRRCLPFQSTCLFLLIVSFLGKSIFLPWLACLCDHSFLNVATTNYINQWCLKARTGDLKAATISYCKKWTLLLIQFRIPQYKSM